METRSIEFKAGMAWPELISKIVKTSMAMANLPNGGLIIIGVSETAEGYALEGVTSDVLASYDIDICRADIAKFAEPAVDVRIFRVEFEEKIYIVFEVAEFEYIPVVCKRNHEAYRIFSGKVYCRPLSGNPRTEGVSRSEDMREIIKLASLKEARRMIHEAGKLGLLTDREAGAAAQDQQAYEQEAGEL